MWCVARDRDVTVLLTGESGTGKERVARAIQRASPRANAPFVVVDCAGLSATLAEDTLFGHIRGAFTGAIDERLGPFERANGGTVLLDEIGDLPLELQMKLLRAIQSRTIQRLGARQELAFDVRIIAATNVDLNAARAAGRFRDDLYYRLNVFEISVPPLRRRGAVDVRALVTTILQHFADRRRIAPPLIDAGTMERLLSYAWPGNVRELENTLHRAVLLSSGPEIGVDGILSPDGMRLDQARSTGVAEQAAMAAEQVTRNLVGRTVAEVERDLILETLKHCLGNRTHAANILGISIRTLRNKLNEYSADGAPIPPPHGGEMRGAA